MDTEMGIRKLCVKFIVLLVSEVKIPSSQECGSSKMSPIAPENCLRRIKDSFIPLCLVMGISKSMLSDLELQWQKMNFVEWENVIETVVFWAKVSKYRDASKENPFRELCNLAKMVLVLPWSNAEVERCFSEMNVAKTPHRNRMGNTMLNSILTIRAGLRCQGMCSQNFQLNDAILKKKIGRF